MPEFHEKECLKCHLYLAPELWDKNKGRKDGLATWCKYCMAAYRLAHREKNLVYQRQYRKANVEALKDTHRKKYLKHGRKHLLEKKYGITEEIYSQMLTNQSGCCAICLTNNPGTGLDFFCVDHDHVTNHVRGLLCVDCNTGLGKFKENPITIREAALYIERGGFKA